MVRGVRLAPPDTTVRNPAFDVTPAELITGLITEEGVVRPPFATTLADAVASRAERRAKAPGFAALAAPTV
jgi:methylthioribose-1-phosphate isomerase